MDDNDGCGCTTIIPLGIAAWLLSAATGGPFWPILLALIIIWIAV